MKIIFLQRIFVDPFFLILSFFAVRSDNNCSTLPAENEAGRPDAGHARGWLAAGLGSR